MNKPLIFTVALSITLVLGIVGLGSITGSNDYVDFQSSIQAIMFILPFIAIPALVFFVSSIFIFRAEPNKLIWRTPLKLSLGFLVVLIIALVVYLGGLSLFGNVQGEEGMVYVILPYYALWVFAGYVVIIFIVTNIIRAVSFKKIMLALYVLMVIGTIASIFGIAKASSIGCTQHDDKCLGRVAGERKDLSICNRASGKIDCYLQYAIGANDPSICDQIPTTFSERKQCFEHFDPNIYNN